MGVISLAELMTGSFSSPYPPSYNVIFIHQYKAFGSSFSYVLSKNYRPESIYHFNAEKITPSYRECLIKNNRLRRVLFGHFPLLDELLENTGWEKTLTISLVRDPLSRALSYFNYIKSRQNHALYQKVVPMSFSEFIRTEELAVDIRNGQTRRLIGNRLLDSGQNGEVRTASDLVIKEISRKVTVLMPVEGFDYLLMSFRLLLGWNDIYYRVRNRSDKHLKLKHISPEDTSFIRGQNRMDTMLYQTALSNLATLKKKVEISKKELALYAARNTIWKWITKPL